MSQIHELVESLIFDSCSNVWNPPAPNIKNFIIVWGGIARLLTYVHLYCISLNDRARWQGGANQIKDSSQICSILREKKQNFY